MVEFPLMKEDLRILRDKGAVGCRSEAETSSRLGVHHSLVYSSEDVGTKVPKSSDISDRGHGQGRGHFEGLLVGQRNVDVELERRGLHNSGLERTQSGAAVGRKLMDDARPAGTLAHDRDPTGAASESTDVLLHPLQRKPLVVQAEVRRDTFT